MWKSLLLLVQLFAGTYSTEPLGVDLYYASGTSIADGIDKLFEPLIDEPMSENRPPLPLDSLDIVEDGAKVNRESLDSTRQSLQKRSES